MQAAKRVFADLRRLLDKSGHVSAQQWEAALVSSEVSDPQDQIVIFNF